MGDEAHDVYRIFDEAGCLLYVGCSINAFARVPQHKHENQPWWGQARRVDIDRYPSKRIARGVEAAAIANEAPMYNRAKEAQALRRLGDFLPVSIESDYDIGIGFFTGEAA